MKTKTKSIIAAMTLFLMLPLLAMPASAMTMAPTDWSGSAATGAMSADVTPIIVEKETLTFDLSALPETYYETEDAFLAYTGSYTAEYILYNPTAESATTTLALPFGISPSYDYGYSDISKYSILINGEAVEAKLRHTYSYPYTDFDPEIDLPLLLDDYITDDFLSPDTTVTKYTFKASGVDRKKNPYAYFGIDINPEQYENTLVYINQDTSAWNQEDGDYRLNGWIGEAGDTYVLYAFGDPIEELPEWRFYKDVTVSDGEEISGTASLITTETFTYSEFVFENYDEARGISEIDWYNAAVTEFKMSSDSGSPIAYLNGFRENFESYVMRWYQYDITIDAGERLTVKVTAPMYPDVDTKYEPPIYTYTYLLSPAATWADFGSLDVNINTPYYMIESNTEGFTKTESGYKLSLEELPKNDSGDLTNLSFTLCTSENPEYDDSIPAIFWIILIIAIPLVIIALVFSFVVTLVTDLVKMIFKKR